MGGLEYSFERDFEDYKKSSNKRHSLKKYNIHLRPEKIENLKLNINDYLYESRSKFKKPSLGYHITLLGFYAYKSSENSILKKFSKIPSEISNNTIKEISLDSPALFDDSLVIKIEPEKIKSLHNIVLDGFISEIVLKGNVSAIENKELFDKRYLFVGDKYTPHMTVAKGIFSGNVLENIEQIINSNNTNYNFKLVLSRKDKNSWKNISEV